MTPEVQKDRALSLLAVVGIAGLVVAVLIVGAVLYSRWDISTPVRSADTDAYAHPTPVTPEVQAEIDAQKRASEEWNAAREKERLELERRTESRD